MTNKAHSTEFVIVISYQTKAYGTIVLLKSSIDCMMWTSSLVLNDVTV